MVIDHEFYMSLAIQEAWKNIALTYPNPSVGAVILDQDGKLLAVEATQPAGEAHAELKAIESALIMMGDTEISTLQTPHEKHAYILNYHNDRLKMATLYVTLEPCNHEGKTPACSRLVQTLGFSKVFCGTKDPHETAAGGLQMLSHAGIVIELGLLQEACETLLLPFKRWQENKPFIFYKLALTANGVYDGGIITSKSSRQLVHQMRSNIDLLVIGGETVRSDRPTLDSRLCSGKAPDVLILSRQKTFDQTIPLFSVPNRKVLIEENFDRIHAYRFIMIEGTQNMMMLATKIIDWYCFFHSSDYKEGQTIQIKQDFKRLCLLPHGDNTITWLKKS